MEADALAQHVFFAVGVHLCEPVAACSFVGRQRADNLSPVFIEVAVAHAPPPPPGAVDAGEVAATRPERAHRECDAFPVAIASRWVDCQDSCARLRALYPGVPIDSR